MLPVNRLDQATTLLRAYSFYYTSLVLEVPGFFLCIGTGAVQNFDGQSWKLGFSAQRVLPANVRNFQCNPLVAISSKEHVMICWLENPERVTEPPTADAPCDWSSTTSIRCYCLYSVHDYK